ncbi:MAG: hypothetical protein R3A52_28165 [Polyangiales bacterium]
MREHESAPSQRVPDARQGAPAAVPAAAQVPVARMVTGAQDVPEAQRVTPPEGSHDAPAAAEVTQRSVKPSGPVTQVREPSQRGSPARQGAPAAEPMAVHTPSASGEVRPQPRSAAQAFERLAGSHGRPMPTAGRQWSPSRAVTQARVALQRGAASRQSPSRAPVARQVRPPRLHWQVEPSGHARGAPGPQGSPTESVSRQRSSTQRRPVSHPGSVERHRPPGTPSGMQRGRAPSGCEAHEVPETQVDARPMGSQGSPAAASGISYTVRA